MYTNKWAYQEDVLDAMVGFPVSLEGVDTNGTIFGHIWVEDFGQEKTCVCVCVCKWSPLATVASLLPFFLIPCGGVAGKSFPRTSFILNRPPSYGVPAVGTGTVIQR